MNMARFIVPWEDQNADYVNHKGEYDERSAFVLREGNVEGGEYVAQFERDFASYCKRKYAISVGSGSDAISLALQALALSDDDEVITAANSGCPVPLAIVRGGGVPVLVDIEKTSFNMDPLLIEKAISPRTRVIHAQHGYGIPCEIDAICEIAKAHKLILLEDIAVAVGAEYKGRRAGEWGDVVVCSFTAGKALSSWTPAAGMVLTDLPDMANRIRTLGSFGQRRLTNGDHIPEEFAITDRLCVELGMNSRLGALQAGILDVKLKYYNDSLSRKREIAQQYREMLKKLPVVLPACQDVPNLHPVYRGYVIGTVTRNCVYGMLRTRGIEARIHYTPPVHLQPALAYLGYKYGDFPIAEEMARRMISLPIHPEMGDKQVSKNGSFGACESIRGMFR